MKYVRCINNEGNEASLEVGVVYRALPTTMAEAASGMLRVIDNEGEDYLYPCRWFEAVPEQELASELSEPLTIHLKSITKIAIRDMANARGISMSALVREWIEERILNQHADRLNEEAADVLEYQVSW